MFLPRRLLLRNSHSPGARIRTALALAASCFAVISSSSAVHAGEDSESTPAIHVRNFAIVNDHLLRGGQPEPDGFRELAANHVTLILNLREPGPGSEAERRLVEQLGMRYINVPIPRTSAPSMDEIKRVLALITPDDNGKTFVHCLRGKDRTGTVIACYRIQHDGWSPQRAAAEARSMGMSHVELGMHAFILGFHPVDLPTAAVAGR